MLVSRKVYRYGFCIEVSRSLPRIKIGLPYPLIFDP